ncbi:sugar phosphate isomerase/epimerase family protein [Ructibacterium gallinarum]|uniref:Sugar phosphate isomerase/epimerase n=1 Tax=Ructibacterium gallinarum TaxID=2779355 RepID=A0A9D5M1C0_9FIRM|nr:TIM barrel protein [Ructibacterium gallinarum]MBE5040470.1 sugar phosphate isomerase/epimerase [Ructibacterium gallinarum]
MFQQLNLGMRGHDIACTSPEQLADTLAQAGASHVQLALKKSFPWITGPSSLTPAFGRYLNKLFDSRGIHVSVLGCYINPVDADEQNRRGQLEWFKANLEFSKYLGADMVGTETGCYIDQGHTHTEENYQRFLSSMKELTTYAEATGTVLGVESVTVHTLSNASMMHRFLQDIDSPSISVIFDPVNMLPSTDLAIQHKLIDDMYALCGERIRVLHLKDYRMEGEKRFSLLSCAPNGYLDHAYLFDTVLRHSPCIDAITEETSETDFPNISSKLRRHWTEAVQRYETK